MSKGASLLALLNLQRAFGSLACTLAVASCTSAAPIRFSADILPLLATHCLHCHGPDEAKRKADLRLDVRESAIAERPGTRAIVPGKPELSDLIHRITSADPNEVMPPPTTHKPALQPNEIATLTRWIAEGAVWGKHWALERPQRAAPPTGFEHPVDAWVGSALAREGLRLSPPAAKHRLLRRISFDLTGLPPSPEQAADFEQDQSPKAFARVVQRLLASPHFGERMAMWWLDAARYSDTDGFQQDAERTNWPWRDWVVAAFNANMPFDQFTRDQFAGDLLSQASPDQQLATCFHRNHMTNGEGGRDPEESRVDYVIDRVNTVGTTWLGLTLGCAQCHSHKFDPISQAEYYRLSAFFNSIDETGSAGNGAKPYLSVVSPAAQRSLAEVVSWVESRKAIELKARRDAESPFKGWLAERLREARAGVPVWQTLEARRLESAEGTELRQSADGIVRASGPRPNQDDYRLVSHPDGSRVTGLKLEVFPHPEHTQGRFTRGQSGEFILTDLKLQVRRQGQSGLRDVALASAVADFSADTKANDGYGNVKDTLDDDPRNGWTTQGATNVTPHVAVFALAEPLRLGSDEEMIIELRHRSTRGDANIGRFRLSATSHVGETVQSVKASPLEELATAAPSDTSSISPELRERLFAQFLEEHEPYRGARQALDRATRQLNETRKAADKLNVMVLADRAQPRETHVLIRGVWDKPGERVSAGVPASIAPWPEGQPTNRLGLALWITSPDNPLSARVLVNHLWQLLFGFGLVRTPEDFGLQGERPTHPELLDWLACELIASGWNIKQLLALIVSSATYQQDSTIQPSLLARDPENRLLARGARYRLPSWMLRDAALRAAGLLNPALGGPPIRPYQPEGVWEELFMGRFKYEPSQGGSQYRRTLYAFWRRAIAPTFLFDSAQRRTCEVRIPRTNTPLQALTLLNDETYLEASRALGKWALESETTPAERVQALFRRILSRSATDREREIVLRQLEEATSHYQSHPADATKLLRHHEAEILTNGNRISEAAYSIVASLLLNLDEAITHE